MKASLMKGSNLSGSTVTLKHALSIPEFSYSLQINVCVKVCYFNAAEFFPMEPKGRGEGGGKELGPLFVFNPLWPTPLTV